MEQKIPAVSVVIPMYNAEKFIGACLESIFAQNFKDFEVIVVDDCSTDNSVAVVENYLKRGGQLKLLKSKKNFGNPCVPRNKGLNISRGKYIYFMDNDDLLIDNNALEKFYSYAENYDADFVYTYKFAVSENDGELKGLSLIRTEQPEKPFFILENPAERFFYVVRNEIGVMPWLKFSRRDFLLENEIYFPEIYSNEDHFWTIDLTLSAKKILAVPEILYINRSSQNSITRKEKTPAEQIKFFMYFIIKGFDYMKKITDKHEVLKKNPQYIYSWMQVQSNFSFTKIFNHCANLNPYEVYKIFHEQFAQDTGENAELVSYLCSMINTQQKQLYLANAKISELEKRLSQS